MNNDRNMNIHSICVFASSSQQVAEEYFTAARELGKWLASEKIELIYGGGKIGLMGALAKTVYEHGGRITSVIPEKILQSDVVYADAHNLIITSTLRERKEEMEYRADAFVALPGGFGTLDELAEMITLKQLGYHQKPVVLLNIKKFFDPLEQLFQQFYQQNFAHSGFNRLYYFASSIEDMAMYLKNYVHTEFPSKLNG